MNKNVTLNTKENKKTNNNIIKFESEKAKRDEEFTRKIHLPSPIRVH